MICFPTSSIGSGHRGQSKATKRKTSEDEPSCKRQRTEHDSDCFLVIITPELGVRSGGEHSRNKSTFVPGNNTNAMICRPTPPIIIFSSEEESGYDSDCIITVTAEPSSQLLSKSKRSGPETKPSSGSNIKEMCCRSSTPTIIIIPDSCSESEASRSRVSAADQLHHEKQTSGDDSAVILNFESTSVSLENVHRHTSDDVLLGHKSSAHFEANYIQFDQLGQGGLGTVYAGLRRSDGLPVAIKHVSTALTCHQTVTLNGKEDSIPTEVLLMHKAAGEPESLGTSAAVALLDWYDLQDTVVLVMERPVPCMDLRQYIEKNRPLDIADAKSIMRQLVDAAIDMRSKGIFHRDIKADNVLVESGSGGDLRVHIIDFGCGCNFTGVYYIFLGTYIYTPPEFYMEGKYKAGPTTVWQLAALLAEMMDEVQLFTTRDFLNHKFQIGPTGTADHRDLLNKCLVIEPEKRATLDDMQLHPWLN